MKSSQAKVSVERIHLMIVNCIHAIELEYKSFDKITSKEILSAVAWKNNLSHTTISFTWPIDLRSRHDSQYSCLANWKKIRISFDNQKG